MAVLPSKIFHDSNLHGAEEVEYYFFGSDDIIACDNDIISLPVFFIMVLSPEKKVLYNVIIHSDEL